MLAQSQKWLDGDASRETVTPHEELTAGHSPYLDNALDACDLGLLVVNRYAQVAHWNAWLERAAELQREVVLGHTLLELFPELRASQLVGAILGCAGARRLGDDLRASTPRNSAALP